MAPLSVLSYTSGALELTVVQSFKSTDNKLHEDVILVKTKYDTLINREKYKKHGGFESPTVSPAIVNAAAPVLAHSAAPGRPSSRAQYAKQRDIDTLHRSKSPSGILYFRFEHFR